MNTNTKYSLMEIAGEKFEQIREIRRHLHAHPELSFQEYHTTRYIKEQLSDLGLEASSVGLDTGCMTVVGDEGPAVLLRADIDALPIEEKNEIEYCSTNPGVMHACGHDVHTACLLGAIQILKELQGNLRGRVVCIFQPGEETLPGGAVQILDSGILDDYQIVAAYGQHVHPPLRAGKLGFRAGPYMASGDRFAIRVKGKGGHGAIPHDTIDPIAISASMIQQLQQVVSRKANPISPSVFSLGKIKSEGGSFNIIPNSVYLEGTFRCLDEDWRERGLEWIQKIIHQTVESHGGEAEIDIQRGYPVLVNAADVTNFASSQAAGLLGQEHAVELPQRLSSEDFAYIAQRYPSCFYRLGTGFQDSARNHSVHTDKFDIDEEALKVGSAFMAKLALETLQKLVN